MNQYLESSEYIDWATPAVGAKAIQLAEGKSSEEEIVRACFEFVRDEIKHSWDYRLNPVTSKASEVLEHETGYCYSKSHLLAALLRANGIPAALCYQRLTFENDSPPFCLHGLNAVLIKKYGWIRIDARGNREDVSAIFDPPHENLAFEIKNEGEQNIAGLFGKPLDEVIEVLTTYTDFKAVADNLPDLKTTKCEQRDGGQLRSLRSLRATS
jgi:transglutaminase-like putative cysteine protease